MRRNGIETRHLVWLLGMAAAVGLPACDGGDDAGGGGSAAGGQGGGEVLDAGPGGSGGSGGGIVGGSTGGSTGGGTGGATGGSTGGSTGGNPGVDAGPGGAVPPDALVPGPDGQTPPGGCILNDDCDAGEYCAHPEGDCPPGAPTGTCTPRPMACDQIYAPVCGCDGNTYGNACEAAGAGVNVALQGECRATQCDDGTSPDCPMPEPECPAGFISAVQGHCWACVDPVSCTAETRCASDAECLPDDRCDSCAHGSCPVCDDCVSACVPHGCQSENVLECNAIRPDCGEGQTAVVRGGCWLCVSLETCEPPAEPGSCEATGGYCEDWMVPCRQGFVGEPPLDCPEGRSAQCCVPAGEQCIGAGEVGPVVPDAPPCCGGLTPAGVFEVIDGRCEGLDGGFVCIASGDGLCGPGENLCNSPDDCAEAPVDCIPAGGSGAVVPGALPCCPGTTQVGCTAIVDGMCELCVGGFSCIVDGDGLCGEAENLCNSPADCAR